MTVTYVISNSQVRDQEKYDEYRRTVPASVNHFGASYLARGARYELIEGGPVFERFSIMKFPDWDAARTWYHSREYGPAKSLRLAAARTNMLMVEGLAGMDDALGEAPGLFFFLEKVHDEEAMADYSAKARPTVVAAGGRPLIAGGRMERLEGNLVYEDRAVLLAFDSFSAAKAWYDSEDYAGPKKMRHACADAQAVLLEGI